MVAVSPTEITSLVFVAILVVVVGRRAILTVRGTTLSLPRLFAFLALFVLLFALLVLEELFYLPWFAVAGELAIGAVVAVVATPFIQRRVVIYQDPERGWSYRLGYIVPTIYLGLFVLRFVLDALLLGIAPLSPPPAGFALSPEAELVLGAVDALLAVSLGLVVARTWAIYRAYEARLREHEPVRASGPGPLP